MKHPIRTYALLVFGTGLYFFANLQRVAIPGSIFTSLQQEFGVSAHTVSALGSIFMLVYAVNQLFTGLMVDRFGGIRVISIGALVFCAGSLLFPVAHSLPTLFLSRVLTGFGASVLYLSLVKETTRSFGENHAIAISFVIMFGYAGGIVANGPFVAGASVIGYRGMLTVIGVTTFAFYLFFLLASLRAKPQPVFPEKIDVRIFVKILRSRHNRSVFIFSGLNWGLYYVIQTVIGKKFLEDFGGLSAGSAAWTLSLMSLLSAVSGLLFAVLGRMTGNQRRIFCLGSGFVCVFVFSSIAFLVTFDIRTPAIAILFCLLALTASMSSTLIPLLRETNDDASSGPAVSFMNFSLFISVALFGNIVGILMDLFPPELSGGASVTSRKSYASVFIVLTVFAVAVWAYSMRIRETLGRRLVVV